MKETSTEPAADMAQVAATICPARSRRSGAVGPGWVARADAAGRRARSPRPTFEVVWPDLSGPLADYPSALEQALDSPVELDAARAPGGSGRDGGDRGRRPVALDAGPRGVADRPAAAACGGRRAARM